MSVISENSSICCKCSKGLDVGSDLWAFIDGEDCSYCCQVEASFYHYGRELDAQICENHGAMLNYGSCEEKSGQSIKVYFFCIFHISGN